MRLSSPSAAHLGLLPHGVDHVRSALESGFAAVTRPKNRSVVMVCSQMPPVYGGAGAQAALLGRTLTDMGWEVAAITLDQAKVGSGTERGVRVIRLLSGLTPENRWKRLLTTLGLGLGAFLHIVSRRPSVVHIHGAYWWSILPAIAGRCIGAKVVTKLTRDGEDDARTVYAKRIGPVRVGKVYGLSLTLADAVVVLNEDSKSSAVTEGLVDRVHLISNGVDEERMARTAERRIESRATKSLAPNDRVVIFVGYLVEHKGVVDLLEAWRGLEDRAAFLWLVGPYEGFYRELDSEIPRLISELVRDGFKVETLGHRPAEELPALYWAADVFTLPSYAEGMPNSLAEALVAGCHVVATRIPGITELMSWDSSGLIEPGDVAALTKRLATALDSPRQAPAEAIESLRISSVARLYEQLYQELFTTVSI